jgi:hypothetical protein
MKWLWFEKRWETKPAWIRAAKKAVGKLWLKYKDVDIAPILGTITAPLDDDEDWSNAPDNTPIAD